MGKDGRWINVPVNIKLRDPITRQPTGEEFDFFTWVQGTVLLDMRFAVDWKTNRSAMNISDAFFGKRPGDWVRLNDSDYDLLKQAVEEPLFFNHTTKQAMKGYTNIALFQQLGSFIEAVLENVREAPPEG